MRCLGNRTTVPKLGPLYNSHSKYVFFFFFDALYFFSFCYFLFIRNDIALVKLADPVYDNGYVAIANLPHPGQMLPHDFTCYITGWGLMDCETHTHMYYISHAQHTSNKEEIPTLPLHSLFSQTKGASLPSCRRLPSPWWSIQSALSLIGGAAMLWKPWCVLEGMESYQAARYSKHTSASAECRAVLVLKPGCLNPKLACASIYIYFCISFQRW